MTRRCKIGCTCKLCLLDAYHEWSEQTDDPDALELIAEFVLQTQDVVNDDTDH